VIRWALPSGEFSETLPIRPARLPFAPLIQPVVNLSADATRAIALQSPAEVFDLATGEDLFCVPPPSSPAASLGAILAPDGKRLIMLSRPAPGQRTGSCVVWDLTTQKRLAHLAIPSSMNPPWAGLSPSGARIAVVVVAPNPAGGAHMVVIGFDLKTRKKLAEVKVPVNSGRVALATASETSVAVASVSGRVWSVDYATGRIEEDIEKRPASADQLTSFTMSFSPDGKRFALGVVGQPYTTYGVRVYDWEKRKALHTFIGHAGPVTTLRFSADGKHLASGAEDTSVLLWDLTELPEAP
jgi:WD40 repeat protein